jgi:hypothetical protein
MGYDFYHGVEAILDEPLAPLIGIWQRWDAIHYIRIAQGGYASPELTAFFPAFPLLGLLLRKLAGLEATLSLIAISNLSIIAALTFFYQLTHIDFPIPIVRRSTLLLMAFPTAFFLLAPYAESLALLFVLTAFLNGRRSRWIPAALAGIGAGLTHPSTLPLVLGLAWLAWRDLRSRTHPHRWLSPLAATGPILGSGAFLLWRELQGFEPYTKVQSNFGWRTQWPWQTFLEIPDLLRSDYFWVTGWVNLAILVVLILSTYGVIKKLNPAYAIFYGGLMLFFLSTSRQMEPFASWGRHALLLFPLFILAASWLEEKRRAFYVTILTAGLQIFLAGLFFMWIWQG